MYCMSLFPAYSDALCVLCRVAPEDDDGSDSGWEEDVEPGTLAGYTGLAAAATGGPAVVRQNSLA